MLRKVFILIIGLLSAISTYSEIVNVDNVSYDLEAGTKTAKVIAKTEKYSGNIVIPSSVKYKGSSYNVTGIGDRSFWSCEFLSFISIPSSVTSIEGDVFSGCNSLTSINVSQDNPNYCSDMGVLFDKNKTTLIHYPANKSGSSYSVPNSVRNIEECAFRYCPNLTSISIPNSVMSIGSGAFHGCSGLSSVTIPRGVKSIENRTFKDCSSLISVTIPNSVISIGKGAFESCSDLESITIPNSVTIIGNSAFRGCTALTSVTIPSSVTSIGKKVFESCGLTSVTIPSSVTNIGGEAFSGCNSLTSINVSQDNPNYCSDMGVLFDKNKTTLIHYPANKSGSSYSVPNSVKSIEPLAFSNCDHLESVLIPNSVTSIELFAFSKCRYLESVTIPNSVTSIGNNAFYGCDNLTVRTSSSASLANAGIPEDRIIRISQEEALADYAQADNTSLNAEESEEDVVFRVVETMPSFPGGDAALMKYISGNLQYPAFAQENGIEGRAICQFTIEKDGSITNIEIVRPAGDETLDNEAKRLIESMPKWSPGLQRGQAVRVSYTIPINFRLSDEQKASLASSNQTPSKPQQSTYQPPLLVLVDESISLEEPSKNNCIDADEQCEIKFSIINNGKGAANNCEARVKLNGATAGLSVSPIKLPSIAPGKLYDVSIPIVANILTNDGNVTFTVEVYEPNGWGMTPFDLTVATKAYEPPYLQVVDYNIASNSGKIRKMEPFTLTFNLQNTKYGDAENVKVKVILPSNVFVMDGSSEISYSKIKSGEVKPIQLTLAANNNYPTTNIPIVIDIKEKHGKFAENKQLDIALNQTTSSSISLAAKDEPQKEHKEIQLAMLNSEVDRNIPVTPKSADNTFVLIIANEHYQQVAPVPYALNDGNIFREYCIKTLGVSEKHIHYIPDATINNIRSQINWLANITETWDDPQVIVYYAGHGIPDEVSKSAYLLPVDGSGTDVSTGYKLDELYATLGNMPASQIIVFMDACFSGSKREDGMLASARGVALKAKSGVPHGNMVVFSAAQGDETAYPYREQQHGMFTYHLLKKLQETAGEVTLQDLGNYIITEVKKRSIEENDKKQTPCVTPSATLGTDWQNWKLK